MKLGEFLLQKALNMQAWLIAEGCELANLRLAFTETTTLLAAQELRDNHHKAITEEDFNQLVYLPSPLDEIALFVRDRPDLHNKFWRYLKLFSEAVGVDG